LVIHTSVLRKAWVDFRGIIARRLKPAAVDKTASKLVKGVAMPFKLGAPELVIILVIVILIFGVGRISKISSELGSGIRAFREGLKGPDDEKKDDDQTNKPA
jgi:sec-independent protein translocase protein TatA